MRFDILFQFGKLLLAIVVSALAIAVAIATLRITFPSGWAAVAYQIVVALAGYLIYSAIEEFKRSHK